MKAASGKDSQTKRQVDDARPAPLEGAAEMYEDALVLLKKAALKH